MSLLKPTWLKGFVNHNRSNLNTRTCILLIKRSNIKCTDGATIYAVHGSVHPWLHASIYEGLPQNCNSPTVRMKRPVENSTPYPDLEITVSDGHKLKIFEIADGASFLICLSIGLSIRLCAPWVA